MAGDIEASKSGGIALVVILSVVLFFIYIQNNGGTPLAQPVTSAVAPEVPHANSMNLPPVEPASNWVYSEEKDPMGRGTIKDLRTMSTNEVIFHAPYEGPQHMTLALVRHPKYGRQVILSIERGQFNGGFEGCDVDVRFGEGKAHTWHMSSANDGSTTSVGTHDFNRFVASARKVKAITIEAEFYQEGTRTFTFDSKGLKW